MSLWPLFPVFPHFLPLISDSNISNIVVLFHSALVDVAFGDIFVACIPLLLPIAIPLVDGVSFVDINSLKKCLIRKIILIFWIIIRKFILIFWIRQKNAYICSTKHKDYGTNKKTIAEQDSGLDVSRQGHCADWCKAGWQIDSFPADIR